MKLGLLAGEASNARVALILERGFKFEIRLDRLTRAFQSLIFKHLYIQTQQL